MAAKPTIQNLDSMFTQASNAVKHIQVAHSNGNGNLLKQLTECCNYLNKFEDCVFEFRKGSDPELYKVYLTKFNMLKEMFEFYSTCIKESNQR